MSSLDCFQKGAGDRHSAVHSLAALLQAFKDDDSGLNVNAGSGERKSLTNPVAAMRQGPEESKNFWWGFRCSPQKFLPLLGRKVFALPRSRQKAASRPLRSGRPLNGLATSRGFFDAARLPQK